MTISQSVVRKDAYEKVTGRAKYAADCITNDFVTAVILTSPIAHGTIKKIDVREARKAPGVLAVVIGSEDNKLTGSLIQDRPVLATDIVRYAGEPIAAVVALTKRQAQAALKLIKLEIEPITTVNSIAEALAPDAAILHPQLSEYSTLVDDVKPTPNSNIAASFRIRKGNPDEAFSKCAKVIERRFFLPKAEHLAMEVRSAQAQLKPDGSLWIRSSTQAPFTVRKLVAGMLDMEPGRVRVETALLGGAFGGKSAVMLEYIASLCAIAVPGRRVNLVITREQDMTAAPCKLGLEAVIKLGCDINGRLMAGVMTYWLDCGAYSDISPNMSKAIAVDCTGPYRLDNLSCDSYCVYTNHLYSTAYRGFSHESFTFCVERAMDMLADELSIDPLTMREINAIRPGDYTPTQVEATLSNVGNLPQCLVKLREISDWDKGRRIAYKNGKIRAKGLSCLWKTPNPSFDACAGAIITFNDDGSCNLNVGVVEMGNGGKTRLCQMAADRLRMSYDRVHVESGVDTRVNPEYFKTVASLSQYLAGRAVMNAVDDAVNQIKKLACLVLKCETDEVDYGEERVFLLSNPKYAVGFQDLVLGVNTLDGNSIGQPVIGRGSSIMRHIGPISEDSGKGKVGQGWTVGAQAVEVEYDPRCFTYRIVNAWTVMDIGAVIDEDATRSMIMGGMSMGLSMARGEMCVYSVNCEMENTSMRTYKAAHIGEEPRYGIEFVTTAQLDAPFGARPHSEHGIIGMPAALGNALSTAAKVQVNMLPLTGESLWRAAGKDKEYDND